MDEPRPTWQRRLTADVAARRRILRDQILADLDGTLVTVRVPRLVENVDGDPLAVDTDEVTGFLITRRPPT